MVYCVVYGCNHTTNKPNTFSGSFHVFPSDRKLRKSWILRVNRLYYKWRKNHRICSDHFAEDDFVISHETAKRIGFNPGRFQLKSGAIPSLKLKGDLPVQESKVRRSGALSKRRNLELLTSSLEPVEECTSSQVDPSLLDVSSTDCQESQDVPENYIHDDDIHSNSMATQCCVPMSEKTTMAKPKSKVKATQYCAPSKSFSTQTPSVMTADKGTMCCILSDQKEQDPDDSSDSDGEESDCDMTNDPTYDPVADMEMSWSDDDDDDSDNSNETRKPEVTEDDDRQFIVYASSLRLLLSACFICFAPCQVFIKFIKGTAVTLESVCPNQHTHTWTSQPSNKGMPEGNLTLAASLLFSGCSAVKVINMLKFSKIATISVRTFQLIQRSYIIPAISNVWEQQQYILFSIIQELNKKISVGGDGRCDSPGHCAKYGLYSLLDVVSGLVISTQLIQCNEVGSSAAMEKEGLIRCFEELVENEVQVGTLISDRHPSIRKYMRENWPEILHYFDGWHICKGLKKKLLKQGQKKGYEIIRHWTSSLINHLYWAASSSGGNGKSVQAKWSSVLRHVCDVHESHGGEFPACEHGPLGEREWFKSGSRQHKALETIVNNTYIMKDVAHMSPVDQTSALEGFHKLVCFFAPKQVHFPYSTMKARCLLAAMHFNENAGRHQQADKNGTLMWRATYPKYRSGNGILKPVRGPCTYDYVEPLIDEVRKLRELYPTYREAEQLAAMAPPPITETLETVPKEELVARHYKRFSDHNSNDH